MHDPSGSKGPHKFLPSNAERLLDPARVADVDPAVIAAAMDLRPGDRVADIGCGNGFWLERLLEVVPAGVRFEAMDVSPEMLQALKDRLSHHPRWAHVTLRQTEELRLLVPDQTLQAALLMHVYHEVDDRQVFLQEVLRALCPGGRLVLVDWGRLPEDASTDRGPPMHHRVPRETAVREILDAGFTGIQRIATAADLYGLVARRP